MKDSHRLFPTFVPGAVVAIAALAASGHATAADPASASAQERYRAEVAACNSGQTSQDKATCLREAGAALQQAREGKLESRDQQVASHNGNSLSRCDVFMGEELSACRARIMGHGNTEGATVTSGSVEGGGILRESITVIQIPAEPTAPAVNGGPVVTPLPPAQ